MLAARIRARAAARASKWDSRAETGAPRKQQALRRTTLLSCVLLLIALFAFKSEIYTAWRTSFGDHSRLQLLEDEVAEREELQKPLVVNDISKSGQATTEETSSQISLEDKSGRQARAEGRNSGGHADLKAKPATKVWCAAHSTYSHRLRENLRSWSA